MANVVKNDKSNTIKTRSESLLNRLEELMDGVTKEKITPETVKAATECADKAIQIMRLNFEAHKFMTRFNDGESEDEG